MRKTKRKLLMLVVAFVVLGLISLRVVGERAFRVKPSSYTDIAVNESTQLYQGAQKWLENDTENTGSFFYPLGDAHRALYARVTLAQRAESTLDVQYYLFHDDDVGRWVLAALIEAANRGVKVRLLLDDMDTAGRDGLLIRLAQKHENLSIRVFNPSYWRTFRIPEYLARFPRVTRRMHNKSMTADGISSIVGGRNIGNEYFDIKTDVAFADLDVLASGNIAGEITNEFNAYWHSGNAFDVSELADAANDELFTEYEQQLESNYSLMQEKMHDNDSQAIKATFAGSLPPFYANSYAIYDPPEKVVSTLFDTTGTIGPKILELMGSSENSLLISSPYFIPGDYGMKTFEELAKKHVEITILTNSLAANDVAAVHAAYKGFRKPLLELGVKLYELKPDNASQSKLAVLGAKKSSLHAKAFIVDKEATFIGSFNLDPRSAIHNTEMGIVMKNNDYAERSYTNAMSALSNIAYEVSLNASGNLQWTDIREEGAKTVYEQEPQTTALTRAVVTVISWLPVDWLL